MIHNNYPIVIDYGGFGFTGTITIFPWEFFPIPVTHMKRLMKICQIANMPEDVYLDYFMESLKDIQENRGYISHRKHKMIQDDIKILQERLDRIGGIR